MSDKMNRRNFIKTSALAGTAALIANPGDIFSLHAAGTLDIAAVKMADSFKATQKAVQMLGGIKNFVKPGSSVGLIINAPAWWKSPGSHTRSDIVLSTILMCIEAGAKEIRYLLDPSPDFWNRTPLAEKYKKEIATIKNCSGNYIEKPIPKAKSLKKVNIIKDLFECDAYINLPIIKHHTGTHMTCNLKNLMGANTSKSNQFFHYGSGAKKGYDDVGFLSQCIADLNTLKKPALCIVDAYEFLLDNGPAGPGKMKKLQKVVAGTDPVAVDAYCSTLLNLDPKKIQMLKMAQDHGIGNMDIAKLKIKEA